MAAIPISRALRILAERAPNEPIVIDGDRVVTRVEFDRITNRLTRAMTALGIERGDFVSILLPNSIQFLASIAAAWKAGAIPQPLSAKMATAEREEILKLVKPRLIIGGEKPPDPTCAWFPTGFEPDPAISDDPVPETISPSFKAMASGGSTGRPKIIVAGNPGTIDLEAPFPTVKPNERMLVTGPLYHNAPFLAATTCMLSGGSAVLMAKFDAEESLRLIERHRVNFITLVPTMMQRIWRLSDATRSKYDLSSIRVMIHSAAPCPVWLKEHWIEWLGADRVVEAYGSTEAPGYTVIGGRDWLTKKGSVGKPDPSVCEAAIFREDGAFASVGEIGEVCMRPAIQPGAEYGHIYAQRYRYIGAEPRRIHGSWDSMSDLGYLDDDGYLFLVDRRTDVILRGGAKIYPAEVEAAIDAHPSVRSSVVIGIPDEDLGERVHALVDTLNPVSHDEIKMHLVDRLSAHKIPSDFEFVTSPLRDDAGKVRRSELKRRRIVALNPATARMVMPPLSLP